MRRQSETFLAARAILFKHSRQSKHLWHLKVVFPKCQTKVNQFWQLKLFLPQCQAKVNQFWQFKLFLPTCPTKVNQFWQLKLLFPKCAGKVCSSSYYFNMSRQSKHCCGSCDYFQTAHDQFLAAQGLISKMRRQTKHVWHLKVLCSKARAP